jgi:hypothetical protein
MVPSRKRFSSGFPVGAGFPIEHVFREFSLAPVVLVIRTTLEQPHFTLADLFRAGFAGEHFFADLVRKLYLKGQCHEIAF